MKTWNETIPLLRDDEQKIVANGYPDLREGRFLGVGEEFKAHQQKRSRQLNLMACRHICGEDCFSFVHGLRMAS